MTDIFIAYNDDPTHSEQVRFENWNDFFAETCAAEIDARVMFALSVDDDLLTPRVWRLIDVLAAYYEYLSDLKDEKLAEAAHRSAHVSELL